MEIFIIIGLILLNGILSMSEIALVSARKARLELDAKRGNKSAQTALKLAGEPDRFLSTIQIGITLIGESCSTDREHIAYYSMASPLYRLNAFVRRKNWAMNNPERHLREQVLSYFS